MIRLGAMALALSLALGACGLQPYARPASSGVTGTDGGGEAQLGNTPRGTTNFPYSR